MIRQYGDHGGNIEAAAAQFNRPSDQFLDFSSNINPLGLPPGLTDVLKQALGKISRYPLPHAASLRHLLSETLGLPQTHLLLGNGASDLIHLLFFYLRPRRLLLPVPTFGEYEQAARLNGCTVRHHFLLPGSKPHGKSLSEVLQNTDLLVICNPNNPTGAYLDPHFLRTVLDRAGDQGTTVMIDESFFPFTGFPQTESLVSLIPAYSNLWVLTSLTKLWALPGLRLGYLAGPAVEIKNLTDHGDPWRVNSLAQTAGIYCLGQTGFRDKTVDLVTRERHYLQRSLGQIPGLKVFPGTANFLLAKIERPLSGSPRLYRYLGTRGLLIREATNFRGLDRRYFRIAVRRHDENKVLIDNLRAYFWDNIVDP